MTKKKRELIEILLDNVKPEDWPENLPYAAQDIKSMNVDYPIYAYKQEPVNSSAFPEMWNQSGYSTAVKIGATPKELCEHWNKTIAHRDDFMKRWNERNQVVDSDGWIQWNGGEMPVERGKLIDVKYRNGKTNLHISAGTPLVDNGSISGKYACDWWSSESDWSIAAYLLHATQQQKTPQQLALEKFGTDWHENEGVQPVDSDVLVDVMFFNGTKSYKNEPASTWMWSAVSKSVSDIEKWRIHSDEKESQIDEKETVLESLRQPMPPCSAEIPCNFVDIESPPSTPIGGIEKVISERGNNYGRFEDGAEIMQQLKLIAHTSQGWERMKPIQREGMDMILHKIGRILNGDPSYVDSWIDIEGYSKLVSDWLKGESK